MHQAWPKFVSSLWYATSDDGLAAISYAPCTVNFVAGGTRVKLKVETNYPFEQAVRIEVAVKRPAEFPLYLRIPAWAKQPMINLPDGEIMSVRAGETACIRRKWSTGDHVTLDLPMEPRLSHWYHQSTAVELGPLLMCFRPGEEWTTVKDHPIAPDYEVRPTEDWNWALVDGESMKAVFEQAPVGAFKHNDAVKVLVKAVKAPDWTLDGASAAPPPIAPEADWATEQVIELTPYGNSSLRIAQFPVATGRKE